MEHMERKEKQETVTRLAICVVVALMIYFGGERLCASMKLPLWEKYRPWLEQNKIQAIAIVAAVLFGVSLAVFPLKRGGGEGPGFIPGEAECEPPGPPDGDYEPCEI